MTSLELAKKIAGILDNRKASNINVAKIEEISSLADYFVIATGTSTTHVKALADEVEAKLKAEGVEVNFVEGHRSNSWLLLDYSSVIVHLFTKEGREFYDLDRLWADAVPVEMEFMPTSSIE